VFDGRIAKQLTTNNNSLKEKRGFYFFERMDRLHKTTRFSEKKDLN
jgi:hypothetical protein